MSYGLTQTATIKSDGFDHMPHQLVYRLDVFMVIYCHVWQTNIKHLGVHLSIVYMLTLQS